MNSSNKICKARTFNKGGLSDYIYLKSSPPQAFIGRQNKNEISVRPTGFSSRIISTSCFVLNKGKQKYGKGPHSS